MNASSPLPIDIKAKSSVLNLSTSKAAQGPDVLTLFLPVVLWLCKLCERINWMVLKMLIQRS